MARSGQNVNTTVRGMLAVFDSSDDPVTGLVNSAFTKYVAYNGADNSVTVTVAEIGNGRYGYTFIPNNIGYWHVMIVHSTYNPRGWQDEFDVS